MRITNFIHNRINTCIGHYFPKLMISLFYWRMNGEKLNWDSPQDIDAKIGWLKIYGDTTLWSLCSDKYRVREYVKSKGLEDMLIPLYGKWDSADLIDWETLPDKFVLKTNHGSGDAIVCKDKNSLDIGKVTRHFNSLLKKSYGYDKAELHYARISPCIIAEKLMPAEKQNYPSSSLIDYKIWSFDGSPKYIWAVHSREGHSCVVGVYDLDWNFHPEYSVSTPHYKLSKESIPAPHSLEKMLEAASTLSKGFPELRVDFYEVDGKPYFGEMTFTSASGQNDFYTKDFRSILGGFVDLPIKKTTH